MNTLTKNRAIELLADAVEARGADYRYPQDHRRDRFNVGGRGTCQYVTDGRPDCIIGLALVLDGFDVDTVSEGDLRSIDAGRLANCLYDEVTDAAARVFNAAQAKQDQGHTWGAALESARVA